MFLACVVAIWQLIEEVVTVTQVGPSISCLKLNNSSLFLRVEIMRFCSRGGALVKILIGMLVPFFWA